MTEAYGEEVLQLARRVMRLLSSGLGLEAGRLHEAFGGAGGERVCMRVNFYPKCPQPELTLGVAAHSDSGGMTMLLVDDHVRGLQVRRADGQWITVDPVPDAFIVNIGDQIQARNTLTCGVRPRRSPPGGYSARVKSLDPQPRTLDS
jgi:isopenicillin N synthase-like dioxygenase